MVSLPIYMDNHATTQIDPRVLEAMLPYFKENFGNPSSVDHQYGVRALQAVEDSREKVAKLINANPEEIIFTSGATEADNLALQGIARAYSSRGSHIITCVTEHKAILDTCHYLEKTGALVSYIPVDRYGTIDIEKLEAAITPRTILISVMFANNEIGTLAPIEQIVDLAKEHEILFHSDAAQAVGHVPVDVRKTGFDLLSISAHKCYGPKGVGALFVRGHHPRVKPDPIMLGGGQERGIRSGTLNVPAIVGMGRSMEIAGREMGREAGRLRLLTEKMRSKFESELGAEINGHPSNRLPHNLNIFFRDVESKALIQSLGKIVAVSASSACTTNEVEPSHVIMALGFGPERAHKSVRFGLSRFNTLEEVDIVTEAVCSSVQKLAKIRGFELGPEIA